MITADETAVSLFTITADETAVSQLPLSTAVYGCTPCLYHCFSKWSFMAVLFIYATILVNGNHAMLSVC